MRLVLIGFLLLLLTHILLLPSYGLTWDFHFHFFGGAHLLGLSWQEVEPRDLKYTPPDPRHPQTVTLPYGAFVTVPPILSYLLNKNLNILAPDVAYNLPIVVWGVGGIAVLFFFLRQALGARTAVVASVFLTLMPRYFSDLHNDMKDVPMAAVFAINMWLVWRLISYRRLRDCLLAIAAFALAFNTKINALFIPPIYFALALVRRLTIRLTLLYLIGAPVAALALFGLIWHDLPGQLAHLWYTFAVGANNIEVLLNGTIYYSGQNVPWYYPYWYLAITTPLPILLFFPIGLISLIRQIRTKQIALLLILWFFVPLTRYLTPRVAVIDGIRHFEEVLYPLSAIAAVGVASVARVLGRWLPRAGIRLISLIGLISLIWNLVSYHPFQITYFNELVGGIRGAWGKYDLDYWGGSQKYAVAWINKNTPPGSVVSIVMAADVAARYLRSDLLPRLNTTAPQDADYVVLLNRQSFFSRYHIEEYRQTHTPLTSISTQGVALVWIYKNR